MAVIFDVNDNFVSPAGLNQGTWVGSVEELSVYFRVSIRLNLHTLSTLLKF